MFSCACALQRKYVKRLKKTIVANPRIQKDNKVAFIVWIFDALGSPLSKKCSFKSLFHMSDVNNLMPFLRHYIEDDTVVLKKINLA